MQNIIKVQKFLNSDFYSKLSFSKKWFFGFGKEKNWKKK
jgi:hypothetical protein